jgi:NAD(P)-dependent dehydrogenase (short-subunit alcohol dehydrogenase family)
MATEGRLAGKWALVTGSTKGLGQTTAEWLAREGANVVVHGAEEALIAPAVAVMQRQGVEAWGMTADLGRPEEAERLVTAVLARVPHLDILVNNAGGSSGGRKSFWEITPEDAAYTMHTICGLCNYCSLPCHPALPCPAPSRLLALTRGNRLIISQFAASQG